MQYENTARLSARELFIFIYRILEEEALKTVEAHIRQFNKLYARDITPFRITRRERGEVQNEDHSDKRN